mmetsp:Transcript_4427/g.15535  ORF Transcript_4427/g.15535 Transcript_4427/m.15535 type:complete len:328 (-) Transcript_4427:1398-2381(-)
MRLERGHAKHLAKGKEARSNGQDLDEGAVHDLLDLGQGPRLLDVEAALPHLGDLQRQRRVLQREPPLEIGHLLGPASLLHLPLPPQPVLLLLLLPEALLLRQRLLPLQLPLQVLVCGELNCGVVPGLDQRDRLRLHQNLLGFHELVPRGVELPSRLLKELLVRQLGPLFGILPLLHVRLRLTLQARLLLLHELPVTHHGLPVVLVAGEDLQLGVPDELRRNLDLLGAFAALNLDDAGDLADLLLGAGNALLQLCDRGLGNPDHARLLGLAGGLNPAGAALCRRPAGALPWLPRRALHDHGSFLPPRLVRQPKDPPVDLNEEVGRRRE